MALTMRSNRRSITFTMSGFMRCRMRLAELISPDVGEHYKSLFSAFSLPIGERKAFWDAHDNITHRLIREGKLPEDLADFLYASDSGANLSPKITRAVVEVMEGATDKTDAQYGPPNCQDAATWLSFKDLLWDCVLDGTWLAWR